MLILKHYKKVRSRFIPYEAYRDREKKIKAKDTTIEETKREFYCKTPECKAVMILVSAANSEKAYFRRKPSGDKHISIFCSAYGNFDTTEYDEKTFDFEKEMTLFPGGLMVMKCPSCYY